MQNTCMAAQNMGAFLQRTSPSNLPVVVGADVLFLRDHEAGDVEQVFDHASLYVDVQLRVGVQTETYNYIAMFEEK